MVSSTIIHAIDQTTYRQNGWVVYVAGLRHQWLGWFGSESHSSRCVNIPIIPIQSILSFILKTCTLYLLPLSMLLTTKYTGRMAKWSKLLVWGISHFGGEGSTPSPVILLTFLYKVLFPIFWKLAHGIFYHHTCHWPEYIQARWPSALRRWFKAAVNSMARVQVPHL